MALPVPFDQPLVPIYQYNPGNIPRVNYPTQLLPGQDQLFPVMVSAVLNELSSGFGTSVGRSFAYNYLSQYDWNNNNFINLVQLSLDILSIWRRGAVNDQIVYGAAEKATTFIISDMLINRFPELLQYVDQNAAWNAKNNLAEFERMSYQLSQLRQRTAPPPPPPCNTGYYRAPVSGASYTGGYGFSSPQRNDDIYQQRNYDSRNSAPTYTGRKTPVEDVIYKPAPAPQPVATTKENTNMTQAVTSYLKEKSPSGKSLFEDLKKKIVSDVSGIFKPSKVLFRESIGEMIIELKTFVMINKDKAEKELCGFKAIMAIEFYSDSNMVPEVNALAKSSSFRELSSKMIARAEEVRATEDTSDEARNEARAVIGYLSQLNQILTKYVNQFLKDNLGLQLSIDSFVEDVSEDGLLSYIRDNYKDTYVEAYNRFEKELLNMLSESVTNDDKNKLYEDLDIKPVVLGETMSMIHVPLISAEIEANDETELCQENTWLHKVGTLIDREFGEDRKNMYMVNYLVSMDNVLYRLGIDWIKSNQYHITKVS